MPVAEQITLRDGTMFSPGSAVPKETYANVLVRRREWGGFADLSGCREFAFVRTAGKLA